MRCSGILAFVTASFVASKYCGREVRFGDALNKKIVPIYLEPVELSGGMNFILHATQRVSKKETLLISYQPSRRIDVRCRCQYCIVMPCSCPSRSSRSHKWKPMIHPRYPERAAHTTWCQTLHRP